MSTVADAAISAAALTAHHSPATQEKFNLELGDSFLMWCYTSVRVSSAPRRIHSVLAERGVAGASDAPRLSLPCPWYRCRVGAGCCSSLLQGFSDVFVLNLQQYITGFGADVCHVLWKVFYPLSP